MASLFFIADTASGAKFLQLILKLPDALFGTFQALADQLDLLFRGAGRLFEGPVQGIKLGMVFVSFLQLPFQICLAGLRGSRAKRLQLFLNAFDLLIVGIDLFPKSGNIIFGSGIRGYGQPGWMLKTQLFGTTFIITASTLMVLVFHMGIREISKPVINNSKNNC